MAMVDIRKNKSWIWWTFRKKTVGRLQIWRIKPSENHGIAPCFEIGIAALWYGCGGTTAWHGMGSHRGLCNQ